VLAALGHALAPFGLNLIGATTPREYDALVPATHRLNEEAAGAIIVIGSGGGAFWQAYRAHLARDPVAARVAHPLDAFTIDVLRAHALPVIRRASPNARLRLPFEDAAPPLSFVHLAEAAGLGTRSVLGLLVHPEFGPWMALRGAVIVDAVAPAARPAAGFDPCESCRERPCLAACPAHAVDWPAGWDVPACVAFRVARADANPCADRCHARVACVYGRQHRYPDDALAYHHGRAFAVMRQYR
jgi:epoxyqueuosine reductase